MSKDFRSFDDLIAEQALAISIAREFAEFGVAWTNGLILKRSREIAKALHKQGVDFGETGMTAAVIGYLKGIGEL